MRLFAGGEHSRWKRELSAYIDGRLEPGIRQALERHLAGCDGCRTELESLRRVVALVQRLPHVPVPRSFALPEAPARAVQWGSSFAAPLRYATAAAAVLLLAVVAGDLIIHPPAAVGPAAPTATAPEAARSATRPSDQATLAVATPGVEGLSGPVETLAPQPELTPAAEKTQALAAQPQAAQDKRGTREAGFRWAEVALGALVAALAIATLLRWLIGSRPQRSGR